MDGMNQGNAGRLRSALAHGSFSQDGQFRQGAVSPRDTINLPGNYTKPALDSHLYCLAPYPPTRPAPMDIQDCCPGAGGPCGILILTCVNSSSDCWPWPGQVEEMITLAEQTLSERSNTKAERISDLDKGVDGFELKLDQTCIDLLALRAPFASDLRLIASTLKIVPELERIGDHCCNIGRRALILNVQPPVPVGDALERLGRATPRHGQRGHGRLPSAGTPPGHGG